MKVKDYNIIIDPINGTPTLTLNLDDDSSVQIDYQNNQLPIFQASLSMLALDSEVYYKNGLLMTSDETEEDN